VHPHRQRRQTPRRSSTRATLNKKVLKNEGIAFTEVDIETDPAAAEFVASANGGNQTVPTLRFADGSTLTNPSGAQVKAKLAD